MTHDLTHEPQTEQVCPKCKPDTKQGEGVGEARLKPCPFCKSFGDDVDPEFWSNTGSESGPGCMTCGATAETEYLWNTRPIEGALTQRVNELEAELEKWRDHLCGGVPEYRDFGTTGMVMDQRGNLWKKT